VSSVKKKLSGKKRGERERMENKEIRKVKLRNYQKRTVGSAEFIKFAGNTQGHIRK
jgi:hypothetical protein